jgi:anti-sigma regulatory factor (Ser/Thr protein kinase)
MAAKKPDTVQLKIPGDIEYVPSVRKFVSDILLVNQFSQKCAFRSEIIIDEICNNAVTYGCQSPDSTIDLTCLIFEDRIEFLVKDCGGSSENISRLRKAVGSSSDTIKPPSDGRVQAGLGLEIVRMLSEDVDLVVDQNNLTSIRVVRRREESCLAQSKNNGSSLKG